MTITSSSYLAQLTKQLDALNAQILTAKKLEMDLIREQILSILKPTGLTLKEVFPSGRNRVLGPAKQIYANPHEPNKTWSGRGMAPKWVREYTASGGTVADLRIREAA
jgi:DNA-binding protein H-NS